MPPRTRSRTSGIFKRVKYYDSSDLTEDETDSNQVTHDKRQPRKSSEDSDFIAESQETISNDDEEYQRESSSGEEIQSPRRGYQMEVSHTEKLLAFPKSLLDTQVDEISLSVRAQIKEWDIIRSIGITYQREKGDRIRESEIINETLEALREQDTREVSLFFDSSLVNIDDDKIGNYFRKLKTVACDCINQSLQINS